MRAPMPEQSHYTLDALHCLPGLSEHTRRNAVSTDLNKKSKEPSERV